MHHDLDIHPIPEKVLYINELELLAPDNYLTYEEYEKALTGKTISEGGILPEDNVRIYVLMDLNADNIMQQLNMVYLMLKSPDEENETWACGRCNLKFHFSMAYEKNLYKKQALLLDDNF